MKYLCLCYYDTEAFARLDASGAEALGAACRPHDAELRATGKVIALGSLSLPESWWHSLPGESGPRTLAGPYLDGPHQVGAFFVVDAADDDEARAVASKHAAANTGADLGFAVEVRACTAYEPGDAER